jgi:hypothetical protein
LVPVDHELAGASIKGNQEVLKARVIESPVEAIELGHEPAALASAGPAKVAIIRAAQKTASSANLLAFKLEWRNIETSSQVNQRFKIRLDLVVDLLQRKIG